MSQEPDYAELNPALWKATQQVLEHLGLTGSDYSGLISATNLFHLAAKNQAALSQRPPWDYAYGAASEMLYRACQDAALPLAYGWLRGYIFSWFKGKSKGDTPAAEDLAGDVIEIIVKKLGQVRFPTAFLAWAEQIALHHFRDYLSKKNRLTIGMVPASSLNSDKALEVVKPLLKVSEEEVEDLSGEAGPEAAVLEQELRAQLIKCIQAMRSNTKNSRYYRCIIIGYYFENKTIEELAGLLGLPKTTIIKLKSQALLNLRKVWQGFESQDNF